MQPVSVEEESPPTADETGDKELAVADEGGFRKSSLNTTAYRIFKLLHWLTEAPLSVESLNARFYDDPFIRKKLSSDSVWLYINTLKMLGCKISRPMASNNYCYELTHHPFGLVLADEDIEVLVQAKAYIQTRFSHQDMMAFDGFLKRILARNPVTANGLTIEELFEKSRSLDYESFRTQIELMENWIEQRQLLELSYQSPAGGLRSLKFLPLELIYERGVVYVKGDRADKPDLSMLRLERIELAHPIEDETLRQALIGRQHRLEEVVLRIFLNTPAEYEPLDMDEDVSFVEEGNDACEAAYMRLTVHTRDFFQLKQRLLEQGRPFHIVKPAHFREDLLTTLQDMRALYAQEASHGNL